MVAQIVVVTGVNPFYTSSTSIKVDGNNSKDVTSSNIKVTSKVNGNSKNQMSNQNTQSQTTNKANIQQSKNEITSYSSENNKPQDSQSNLQTNGLASIQSLTSNPSSPISLYNSKAVASNSLSIDIGQSGNSRLVVIFADVESTSATLTGTVTVGTLIF